MSLHKQKDSDPLVSALEAHDLPTDQPSQLSDAFRCGWNAHAEAMPYIVQGMIKPLVWEDDSSFSFAGDCWAARSLGGLYRINDTLVGRSMKFRIYFSAQSKPIATRGTLEAAIAAADTHHAAQIMAAMGLDKGGPD